MPGGRCEICQRDADLEALAVYGPRKRLANPDSKPTKRPGLGRWEGPQGGKAR